MDQELIHIELTTVELNSDQNANRTQNDAHILISMGNWVDCKWVTTDILIFSPSCNSSNTSLSIRFTFGSRQNCLCKTLEGLSWLDFAKLYHSSSPAWLSATEGNMQDLNPYLTH